MSDALNYLVKVRPEAMTSYFTFLKKAGDHLDIRTRDLISVITKVAVQTEPGFKQYLTRALRNGASPQEIGERHGRTPRSIIQQLHRQGDLDDVQQRALLNEIEARRGAATGPHYDLAA
jgi:hypothetical protein